LRACGIVAARPDVLVDGVVLLASHKTDEQVGEQGADEQGADHNRRF
jgi:hypothetical protein